MSQLDSEQEVAAVRAFNRFYTRQIGVLRERLCSRAPSRLPNCASSTKLRTASSPPPPNSAS